MLVLVTGATGLLGNNVCRMLMASGHRVRAVVRKANDRSLAGLALDVCMGDIRRLPPTAIQGIEAVIHCAGYVHVGRRHQRQLWETNVDGTAHLLALARGIPFVYVSSIDAIHADGYPESPYALSKAAAEVAVRAADSPAAIVRPGLMFGPYDWKPSSGRLLIEMASGRVPWAPPGSNLFCDARDVAQWCIHAIGRSGVFHPGGVCLDYYELGRLVAQVSGGWRPFGRLHWRILRFLGRCGNQISRFTRSELAVNTVSARCSSAPRMPAHLVRSEGPIPCRDLQETIQDALEWFRKHGYL